MTKRWSRIPLGLSLIVLSLFALTGCKPPKVSPIIFRVMTYNIHHGEGLDGKVDLDRIAKVITNANADAVALQEVDQNTKRTGGIDMAAELAKRTNMHVAFGANLDFQGGKYGTAILSKHPIESYENHVLKQARDGEPRGVLQAVLDVGQGRLLFAGTHLDHTRDQGERLFSQTQFDELFAKYEDLPIIFCGDFNDTPGSELHKRMSENWFDSWELVGQGPGLTMTSDNPTRRIDYVWVSDKKLQAPLDGRAENGCLRPSAGRGRDGVQAGPAPDGRRPTRPHHHRDDPPERHPDPDWPDHLQGEPP